MFLFGFSCTHIKWQCSQDSFLGLLPLQYVSVSPHQVLSQLANPTLIYLGQVSSEFQNAHFHVAILQELQTCASPKRTLISPKSALSHLPWLLTLADSPMQLHELLTPFQPFVSIPITLLLSLPPLSPFCIIAS